MPYKVMSVDDTTVTIWDQVSRDPKHGYPVGTLTLIVGAHHIFQKDDEVDLIISKRYAEEVLVAFDDSRLKCAVHHAYHTLGPNCVPDTTNREMIDAEKVES